MSTDDKRICNSGGNTREFWTKIVNMQMAEDMDGVKQLDGDMAAGEQLSLNKFKMRVDGLRFRLIETWCLCKYCQLYDPANEHLGCWISEFDACSEYLRGFEIKRKADKRKAISKMFIDDYDYNQERKALFIIREKFDALNINDMSKRTAIATSFVNSINGLIDVLSNPRISVRDYVRATFLHGVEIHDT